MCFSSFLLCFAGSSEESFPQYFLFYFRCAKERGLVHEKSEMDFLIAELGGLERKKSKN